jgi:hypothetical protein
MKPAVAVAIAATMRHWLRTAQLLQIIGNLAMDYTLW